MKKLVVFAACAMFAAVTQAASVGWSLSGAGSYANDAYQMFVIGQNGASDIATITALLDAGTDTSSYAFSSGNIGSTGLATVAAAASGKSLDAGTYTAFFVVFDDASPAAGSANYAVVSGAANLTKTIDAKSASVTFAAGSAASILNDSSNWKSFGPATPTPPTPTPGGIPEPTSGLLLLVGGAMLALRRKQK